MPSAVLGYGLGLDCSWPKFAQVVHIGVSGAVGNGLVLPGGKDERTTYVLDTRSGSTMDALDDVQADQTELLHRITKPLGL